MVNFYIEGFNRTVGTILFENRIRAGLSAKQVSRRVKLSTFELYQIENGTTSLPCSVLYKLLKCYKPTEDEIMFFCSPKEIRERFKLH